MTSAIAKSTNGIYAEADAQINILPEEPNTHSTVRHLCVASKQIAGISHIYIYHYMLLENVHIFLFKTTMTFARNKHLQEISL